MSKNPVDNFLNMIVAEKGASKNTVDAYRRDLEQFFDFQNNKSPSSISRDDIKNFIQYLSSHGFANKSVARKTSSIKEFFRFLFSEKEIKENPATYISSPKPEKPLPKFLTPDEITKIISTANNHSNLNLKRIACMLELMYSCGLRVSELVSLPETCINFDKQQILVHGKGSKERLIPISSKAIKSVLDYTEYRHFFLRGERKSIWLFPSKLSKSGHITRDAFFKQIKNLCAQSGISPSRVSPHVLRHSFATHLINNDADLRSVQKMLGHESITTTEIYTHIISDKLIKTVQQKHPLAKK